MYKQTKVLEMSKMPLRCMIPNSARLKVMTDFTLRAEIRPFTIGGYQTILAKRVPLSHGNRPGFILMLNGSWVEFKTFGDGDDNWHITKTHFKSIKTGEFYRLMVMRTKGDAKIYVNGVDRTDRANSTCSNGDVNCDVDAFVGFQVYDVVAELEPMRDGSNIYSIGIYNDIWTGSIRPEVFQPNPNVISLEQLPEMKQRLGMGRKRAYG